MSEVVNIERTCQDLVWLADSPHQKILVMTAVNIIRNLLAERDSLRETVLRQERRIIQLTQETDHAQ